MSRRLMLAFVAAGLLAACIHSRWVLVTPEDHSFSVSMPGQPGTFTKHLSGPNGNAVNTSLMYEWKQGAVGVSFADPPRSVSATNSVPEMLASARDAMLNRADRVIIQEDSAPFMGHPGRNLVFLQDNRTIRTDAKIFMVGNRLYQLQAVFQSSAVDTVLARRFFESFRLADERNHP